MNQSKLIFSIILICSLMLSCASSKEFPQQSETKGKITCAITNEDNGYKILVSTSDPVALRTLIMQGFTLSLSTIDSIQIPLSFPSANDVADKIQHHPGEVKATLNNNDNERRPDLRPVVAALNNCTVQSYVANDTININGLNVSIEPKDGIISYSLPLPTSLISNSIKSIILDSSPSQKMMGLDEFSSKGYASRSSESRPQPFGADKNGNADNQRNIHLEYEFEIKD